MSAKTGADLTGLMSDLPPLGPVAPQRPVPDRPRRHRAGLWTVLGVVLALTLLAHGPMWWPWWAAFRIPWLVVAGVAFVLWRRSRRRRWHTEVS